MKLKQLVYSLCLASVVLGSSLPAAVSAVEETTEAPTTTTTTSETSQDTTVSDSSTTTSAMEGVSTQKPFGSTSQTDTETSSTTSQQETTLSPIQPTVSEEDSGLILERAGILEGIIGRDDQYRVKNTKADPYRKIVRLEIVFPDGSSGSGSGVLIAPNLVLTAGHNIYENDSKQYAALITASAGATKDSTPYGTYLANTFYIFKNYVRYDGDTNYDMAVIKLDKPMPSSVGYLETSTGATKGQKIQVAGYPARSYSKVGDMYTMFGNSTNIDTHHLYYQIDTEAGQSGAPVLNAANQVVAIHTTYAPYDKNNYARRVNADTLRMIDIAKYNKEATSEVTGVVATYRLYHAGVKRHLYTQSQNEASVLLTRGWRYEGVAWHTSVSGSPVYRLYNSALQRHLYTTDANEKNVLSQRGWRYEGVAWHSAGNTPVYRLYSPVLKLHLYTKDANEKKVLSEQHGWRYEGVSWYTEK